MKHLLLLLFLTLNFGFVLPLNSAFAVNKAKNTTVACVSKSANSALIIIDMQPYFANRGGNQNLPGNVVKLKELFDNQLAAIDRAKKANIPIILLEYECGSMCDPTDERIKKAVAGYDKAKIVKKTTDGMLSQYNSHRQELVDVLHKNNISTVLMMGANGGACVLESITGALENNCNVVAYENGIADLNFKDFIFPYNKQNNGGYGSVKPTCEDCTLKEIMTLERLEDFMTSSAGAQNVTQVRKSKNTKTTKNKTRTGKK